MCQRNFRILQFLIPCRYNWLTEVEQLAFITQMSDISNFSSKSTHELWYVFFNTRIFCGTGTPKSDQAQTVRPASLQARERIWDLNGGIHTAISCSFELGLYVKPAADAGSDLQSQL
jgi:hypothetical protein